MELNIWSEGNALNQGLQPRQYSYSPTFSASPQVKIADSDVKKTKAEHEKQVVSKQDTQAAIGQANKLMELFSRDLRFETHEETGIVQVSIVDKNEGKVIKQIPPDEVLKMIARIQDILGSLMDVKA
ncbi:MAG: flagellar protein FlaG [Synergistaceae bacterium]|nr:flagellar protein FlaG [Synergistaceae bacterium]